MDHFGGMDAETRIVIKTIFKTGCENAVFIEPAQNKGLLHDLWVYIWVSISVIEDE
jgi:hypothetical protein